MLCLLVYTKSGHQRFKHAHHRFTREDKERGGNCTTIWFDQVSDCFINFNRVGWEMELLLCPAHKEAAWQDEHSLEPKNSASFDDGLESSENEVALPAKLVPKTLKVWSNWSSVKLICCQNKEIATMLFSSFLSEFWQISRLPGFASYFLSDPKVWANGIESCSLSSFMGSKVANPCLWMPSIGSNLNSFVRFWRCTPK